MTSASPPSRRTLVLLLLSLLIVWFSNLEYRKLVRPDEGRYAEIPREMKVSGDWTTPRLNNIKYFEKPALQYWATAAAYEVFGEHNWTARLWSALTGLFGILFVWFAGCRLFGREAGLYAALVLASSLWYSVIGHINTLDMGVTFFMTLGLGSLLLAQRPEATEKENRWWMLATWAALGLSVLSKGLIGIILPSAVLVAYTLIQRDFALWKRLQLLPGLALLLLITAPWFIAVSLANPEFFHFFFIHEHFERFLTKVHSRVGPPWYFIPILLVGILPWLLPMLDALLHAWRNESADRKQFQVKRFLLVWCVVIFGFFSASGSKLPSYILPIFPALALLIGQRLTLVPAKRFFWQAFPIALLAGACLWLVPNVVDFADQEVPLALYKAYVPWFAAAAALLLAGSCAALYYSAHNRLQAAIISLAVAGLGASQLVVSGHESLSPASSAYQIAGQIRPYLKPGIPFYSIGMYEQTLPFYIKRTVTLVEHLDELEFGIEQEPGKWIPTKPAFIKQWLSDKEALAMMEPHVFTEMQQKNLPMQEIARDTRRVVVKKP